MIYFVEGNSVGSEFGFPRVDLKKRYRWKKMNFTTDLPKKYPFVTYIVASAVKCEKFFPNSKNEGPSFRMHAVILNNKGRNPTGVKPNATQKDYILCHIRKIDQNYKISKGGAKKKHGEFFDGSNQKKKNQGNDMDDETDTTEIEERTSENTDEESDENTNNQPETISQLIQFKKVHIQGVQLIS